MTLALRLALPLLVLAGAIPLAHGEETRSPAELVRALQLSQDKIAQGDAEAHKAQRALLVQIAQQMLAAKPEVWKEPGNARAAIALVLSGGDARVLRRLVTIGPLPGLSEKLVQGVLAHGEGRTAEAAEKLGPINARSLDPSIAGHVALLQAELIAMKEPKKALAFLEDARLLAPGTLIEEAALRRQVAIVAATGEFGRFETLATTYLRRFPKSVYAGAFRRQFAADVAGRDDAAEPSRIGGMTTVLETTLGPADRRDAYLSIAREALARGKVALARFASTGAAGLAEENSTDRWRAELYEVAAVVAGEDFKTAASALEALKGVELAEDDAELLQAARSVVAEVGRATPPAEAFGPAPAEDMAASFKSAAAARQAMARADQLVDRADK